jgi:hypothetical protein
MDDALLPHEREAAEAHAAGCDRCLAVLAATAQTAPEGGESAWWQSLVRARWLVPVTAAAAALTLWIAVDRRAVSDAPRPEAAVADRLSAPASEPAEPAPDPEQKAAPQPSATPAPPERQLQAPAVREYRRREADADAAAAEAPAERDRADAPALKAPAAKEEQGRRVAKNDQELLASGDKSVSRRPAAAPAPPPRVAADEPVAVTQAPEAALTRDRVQRFAAPAVEVRAPDPQVRWRVAADTIQRSVDGGLSWEAQISAAGVSLLAGSAPSSTSCWFAGRSGAVFVTADGVTWRRVTAPTSADLTAVAAEDARAATVTTAAGAVYRTSDGGATWVVQEAPAPSF